MKKPASVAFLTNINGIATANNPRFQTFPGTDFPSDFSAKSPVARLKTAASHYFFALTTPNGEIFSQKPVEFFGTVVGKLEPTQHWLK